MKTGLFNLLTTSMRTEIITAWERATFMENKRHLGTVFARQNYRQVSMDSLRPLELNCGHDGTKRKSIGDFGFAVRGCSWLVFGRKRALVGLVIAIERLRIWAKRSRSLF